VELLAGRLVVYTPWTALGAPAGVPENEHSLVARWQAGGASLLATGDLGGTGERALRTRAGGPALRTGILLAGHHGSHTSTGTALLETVRPGLVIVSCGAGNPHGHPHVETLERIGAVGAGLLRTDRDGTVTLRATPRGFRVRWVRGYPGPRSAFPPFPLSRRSPFS
jgi:competence protein ComEC